MKALLKDFRKFLLQGNIVTLAVAVIIGTVFAAVVKAFVTDIITPIIALIFGKPDFSGLSFSINSSHFLYGDFINVLITFVATAAAIFFFVAKPYEVWDARRAKEDPSVQGVPRVPDQDPG